MGDGFPVLFGTGKPPSWPAGAGEAGWKQIRTLLRFSEAQERS